MHDPGTYLQHSSTKYHLHRIVNGSTAVVTDTLMLLASKEHE